MPRQKSCGIVSYSKPESEKGSFAPSAHKKFCHDGFGEADIEVGGVKIHLIFNPVTGSMERGVPPRDDDNNR